MFAVETDPVQGLSIVVRRPDGTRIVIPDHSRLDAQAGKHDASQLSCFLERNPPTR
jgi:hypothetical protein